MFRQQHSGRVILLLLWRLIWSLLATAVAFDVDLELKGAWPRVSRIQEAIEFVNDVDTRDVPFALRAVCTAERPVTTRYGSEDLENALLRAVNLTLFRSPFTGPFLDLVVSNKYYSARVEFHRTLERQIDVLVPEGVSYWSKCSTFETRMLYCRPYLPYPESNVVDYQAEPLCTDDDVDSLLKNDKARFGTTTSAVKGRQRDDGEDNNPCRLLTFDHYLRARVPSRLQSGSPFYEPVDGVWQSHLIIYSSLHLNGLERLQKLLSWSSEDNNPVIPTIVFRHGDTTDCRPHPSDVEAPQTFCTETPTCCGDLLGMYSAELAVKNPEYKTLDDSDEKQENQFSQPTQRDGEDDEEDDDDTSKPEDIQQLHSAAVAADFEDNTLLGRTDNPDRVLNSEELSLLGFRAVSSIKQFNTSSALDAWKYLAGNFPGVATRLANRTRTSADASVIVAVKRLRRRLYQRAQAVTISNELMGNHAQNELFARALVIVGRYVMAVEQLVRSGIPLFEATAALKEHQIFPVDVDELPRKQPRYSLSSLPTRLDWRLVKRHPQKSQKSIAANTPLVPIWDVLTHPDTRGWAEDVNPLEVMFRGLRDMKIRQRYLDVLVVFDPLQRSQLADALEILKLEHSMALYFIPYVSKACKFLEGVNEVADTFWGTVGGDKPPQPDGGTQRDDRRRDKDVDNDACILQWTLSEMYFRLVSRKDYGVSAVAFLEGILELSKLSLDRLSDIYPKTMSWDSSSPTYELAQQGVSYLRLKGLSPNIIIINGRVLRLRSCSNTLTPMGAQPGTHLTFGQILNIVMAREQQHILQITLFDQTDFEKSPSEIALLHGATPSCLFAEETFLRMNNGLLHQGLCETLQLTFDESGNENKPSMFPKPSWKTHHMSGRAGALTFQSELDPLVPPEVAAQFPVVLKHSVDDGGAPIDFTLLVYGTHSGLKALKEYFSHLQRTLNAETWVFEQALRAGLKYSWRLLIITPPPDCQTNTTAEALSENAALHTTALVYAALHDVTSSRLPSRFRCLSKFVDDVALNADGLTSITPQQLDEIFSLAVCNAQKKTETSCPEILKKATDFLNRKKLSERALPRVETLMGLSAVARFSAREETLSGLAIVNHQIFPILEAEHSASFLGILELLSFSDATPKALSLHQELGHTEDNTQIPVAYLLAIRERVKPSNPWHLASQLYRDVRPSLQLHIPPVISTLPSMIHMDAVLDPLSTLSQEWIPIFQIFNQVLNADIRVVFNPAENIKEYPVNRWYRHVIHAPRTLFLGKNVQPVFSRPLFQNLNTQHTLTAALHVPDHWLIRARASPHDLDNLRPDPRPDGSQEKQVLTATYVLSDIFLTGQAVLTTRYASEQSNERQPTGIAGLELSLWPITANSSSSIHRDTLVMGNLGYFQFQASPGIFRLCVDGHTQEPDLTYVMTPDGDTSYDSFRRSVPVVANSLMGSPYTLYVMKQKKDSKTSKLLEQATQLRQPLWKKVLHVFGVPTSNEGSLNMSAPCTETIHIFSLASGHMYERLLRIMILSVRRHTTCPLAFWFIDNFLSPKFRALMPGMAKRYNITYQFVTYKWPSWLHKQTEKQRQIWAYKILFLDVLFPKDVPRIIYVDADQIVRADVRELWHMDLHGAPYGFTPFCDSNPETEDFRFWKKGYWHDHLKGKPYHISALFVVDLKRFRELAAGDIMRSVYNTLSRDKNSLANLDQDLPNFIQHEIPIFPLPQDWLWCETWCSKESLATAKTIDLCNNPMTKEPKLSQARRIAHEWESYDQEIRRLEAELSSTPPTPSSAASSRVKKAHVDEL